MHIRTASLFTVVLLLTLAFALGVYAGSAADLDPPSAPSDPASQMFTLEQIYDRLDTGAAGTRMTSFTEPAGSPGTGTMHTLDEIYDLIGERAPVPKTGQTVQFGKRDDGSLEMGIAWPNPRFTENGNGTVTDNLTGLIWLKNADCNGLQTWTTALSWANGLFDGCANCGGTGNDCGLSDGSSAEDWRLPNVRELLSLIDFSQDNPALPSGLAFSDVQSSVYWSSTTHANSTSYACGVDVNDGGVGHNAKTSTNFVWPVRGGQ